MPTESAFLGCVSFRSCRAGEIGFIEPKQDIYKENNGKHVSSWHTPGCAPCYHMLDVDVSSERFLQKMFHILHVHHTQSRPVSPVFWFVSCPMFYGGTGSVGCQVFVPLFRSFPSHDVSYHTIHVKGCMSSSSWSCIFQWGIPSSSLRKPRSTDGPWRITRITRGRPCLLSMSMGHGCPL